MKNGKRLWQKLRQAITKNEAGEEDSDEDMITDYLMMADPRVEAANKEASSRSGPSPLVPIISVTPHSPAGKHYPILEDNIQQLHDIHESIQRMRDVSALMLNQQQQNSRLFASCPSLNDGQDSTDPDLLSRLQSPPNQPSQPKLSLNAPAYSDSLRQKRGSGDWLMCEVQRRSSWAALDDLTNCDKGRKVDKHRSVSSSSLESELDDPIMDSTANLLSTDSASPVKIIQRRKSSTGASVNVRRSVCPGGTSSTHSLNEADLQSDFNKIIAKHRAESRLQARLPLQKSVSTPSILAVRDIAQIRNEVGTNNANINNLTIGVPTESETEEEMLAALIDPSKHRTSFQLLFADTAYDEHSEKRRKRGSLFFRKKKDKLKKSPHQWVSVCYGSSNHIQNCDWCSKPITNKSAIFCENCLVTVHQSSCKDHIVDCNKQKLSKSISKPSAVSLSSFSKSSGKTRSGSPSHGQSSSPSRRTYLCYSPWRRVATKLGVNQIIGDDKEFFFGHHQLDGSSFTDADPLIPFEFINEGHITANDLETDPFLGLQDEEPDSWTPTAGKEVLKKLKEKEIKRQEHIYEFILTEKHHCLTLRVMQKVFMDGLHKYFKWTDQYIGKMFPRLADLTNIHLKFLHQLRERQKKNPVIESIGDILLEQFSGLGAQQLKDAYGEFCSRHRDAVDMYKFYLQRDRQFAEFVKHCQANPLLKKKGIPECILFVTQRLTKYPLLIEPLIKTSKENKEEHEKLARALALVKEILVEVDEKVAEKEKEDRKLEIYNKIDVKSFTMYRGLKFRKSDILSDNRKLRFEGVTMLMQGRSKMQYVLMIVLSDILLFLSENNNKYTFFTPDNKAGVVSLQKLLVREKAGTDSRGIYLISSNPAEPEMFELKVHKPKDKRVWVEAIRSAVQNCPLDDDEDRASMTAEQRQKQMDASQAQIKQITDLGFRGILRQKDVEQALILEEKMALQLKLLAASGITNLPNPPSYSHLVAEEHDTQKMWQEVASIVQEQLAWNNSDSGSVHENQPALSVTDGLSTTEQIDLIKSSNRALQTIGQEHQLAAMQLSHHIYTLSCVIAQQMTTIDSLQAQLSAYKSQFNLEDCGTFVGVGLKERKSVYRPNQQLEELRNLQDRLTHEKEVWQREKESEEKYLKEKKEELDRRSEELDMKQKDIAAQRDQLYRKLQVFESKGLLISPNLPVVASPTSAPPTSTNPFSSEFSGAVSEPPPVNLNPSPTDPPKRKADSIKWKQQHPAKASTLPINLLSATNQQKVATNVHVKQQLPLKLASKLESNMGTNHDKRPKLKDSKLFDPPKTKVPSAPGGHQRLGSESLSPPDHAPTHSRTGSSPALMQNVETHFNYI
nr:PREDICTED: rho guanine nucleotide exchange factor 18 isoform X3 [Bemisia tabaci]